MTGRTKTAVTLSAYFAITEVTHVLDAFQGRSTWGAPISMGFVVGLLAVLAFKKKTWARHLILVLLGIGSFMLFSTSLGEPSIPLYAILAIHLFLFWALCWHKPILDYLGVPNHHKS